MSFLEETSTVIADHPELTVLGMKGDWHAELYHSWDLPGEVRNFWEEAARNYGDRGLFLLPEWFEVWWGAFGKKGRLFIVVLYSNGKVRGIFPLWEMGDGILSGMTYGGYFDFLLDSRDRATTLDKFLELLSQTGHANADIPMLSRVEGNGAAFLDALRRAHFPNWLWAESWAAIVNVSGSTWEELERKFGSKLRNNLKQGRRRAAKEGVLKFEEVRDAGSLEGILDEALAVEGSGWKAKAGTAMNQDPDKEDWFRSVCTWAAQRGLLRMYLLRLNERLIAFDMSMEFGRTVFALRTGYAEDVAKRLSPGNLMRAEVLKLLVERPDIDRLDFSGQAFQWELEWNSLAGERIEVYIYPKNLRGWAQYTFKYGWKQPLKKARRIILSRTRVGQAQTER